MLSNFLQAFLSAGTYFLFHKMYFRLVCHSHHEAHNSQLVEYSTFVLNFFVFYLCTMLQLSLVYNWLIFCCFLFIETYFLYRIPFYNTAFLALQGTIYGLSANVFNRCFFAIILHKNLNDFANNPYTDGNIKSIPIILGFLMAAVIFYISSKDKYSYRFHLIFRYHQHMFFLFRVMIVMMLCLLVHLILYNYDVNDIPLKLWGLSSSLFVIIGYLLGLNYTVRLCEFEETKLKNKKLKSLVKSQQELENTLAQTVYLDELTGLYNRHFAMEQMNKLFQKQIQFIICFVDLNHLKDVNDQFGHSKGDYYILTVAQELMHICEEKRYCFRYGGDEFIVLFQHKRKEEIEYLLDGINEHLKQLSDSFHHVYMSMSYGVVSSCEQESVEKLIEHADAIMYEQKKRTKINN